MTSLISDLRQRIQDTRPRYRALSLGISELNSVSVLAEVTNGRLVVTVQTGSASISGLDINLSSPSTNTIGKLADVLRNKKGYIVQVDPQANLDHDALDIASVGPVAIGYGSSSLDLNTHLFSTSELENHIKAACGRHNPSFDYASIPPGEQEFVLMLAHSIVCRNQAYDVSKRRGMSQDADTLLAIANDLEASYNKDIQRLTRALASPKEATPNTMGEGDIVLGTIHRRSLRNGYVTPMSSNLRPTVPILLEPNDPRDVEDDNIKVRWQRNRDDDFYAYELWIDTIPDVQRSRDGVAFGVPFAYRDDETSIAPINRKTTSKLVFRSYGPNKTTWGSNISTFIEEAGQLVDQVNVGHLEPEFEYYFRLFVGDINGELSGSNVVVYKTLPLRAKFAKTSPLSTSSAAVGATVTVNFDSERGALTNQHTLSVGGKSVVMTLINSYQATFVVPNFLYKTDKKDITITSPTKLYDVLLNQLTIQ